ncbi:MAG TPA: hydrogenase maturation nickel metallochaperone HypA [Dehalococcoidales bacterium]|nr:hydrogenase maturation nickel metallochaperone HypA [Dehalococcoidales bacterium]
MGVTQALLDMAVTKARESGAVAIRKINLVIGDLSSVLDNSVQFYFDFISQGTPAEGARLVFRRIPIGARCRRCSTEFSPSGDNWKCPQCLDAGIDIISGNEFFMESIEVE